MVGPEDLFPKNGGYSIFVGHGVYVENCGGIKGRKTLKNVTDPDLCVPA